MLPNRGEEQDKLELPSKLVTRWINDAVCSKDFKVWLDKFCEKYTVVDDEAAKPESKDSAEPKNTKRKPKQTDPNPSPLKKATSSRCGSRRVHVVGREEVAAFGRHEPVEHRLAQHSYLANAFEITGGILQRRSSFRTVQGRLERSGSCHRSPQVGVG